MEFLEVTPEGIREEIAIRLFGWKWVRYLGRPIKGTPGYPAERQVRQFMHPDTWKNEQWIRFFAEVNGGQDADGTEPLSYAYCSMNGPAIVPWYDTNLQDAMQVVEAIRDKLELYLCLMQYDFDPFMWKAMFSVDDECNGELGLGTSDTPARAICLAALNALEIDKRRSDIPTAE